MKEGVFIRIEFLIDKLIEEIEIANNIAYKTHIYIKWS